MRLTEAIIATLEQQRKYWPKFKEGILNDLEGARKYHIEPNRLISNIGLSILNKLNDGDSCRFSQREYEKLHNEAAVKNEYNMDLTNNIDIYVRGLCEAAAWILQDDIDQIICEMNDDETDN